MEEQNLKDESLPQESGRNGHGGRREGAGRPRMYEDPCRAVTIRVPEDVAEILDEQSNKTDYIIRAIRAYDKEQRKTNILSFEISMSKERKRKK